MDYKLGYEGSQEQAEDFWQDHVEDEAEDDYPFTISGWHDEELS